MRPYRQYTPDQAFLLPPSLTDLIPEGDPVFFLRDVLQRLDFEPFHRVYRSERGQPPYHPELMVGLYLYGAMRRVYSSRRLAELCSRDVACMYLVGRATPDYHTILEFRQRFTSELKGLFLQVLVLCREAGLARLGHVSLDGTKVRANASKHKAMSYGRMKQKEPILEAEIASWFEEGKREDQADDDEHGPGDDGWSLPEELKESSRRLEKIRQGKARLETQAREKAEAEGNDPAMAVVADKAQTNFTDPESRIMHTPDGFQQCYNAQAVVDAASQVIVACEVSSAPPDVHGSCQCSRNSLPTPASIPTNSVPTPAMPRKRTSPLWQKPTSSPSSPCAAITAMNRPTPILLPGVHPIAGRTATRCATGWQLLKAKPSISSGNRPSSPSSARSRAPGAFASSFAAGYQPWRPSGVSSAPSTTS